MSDDEIKTFITTFKSFMEGAFEEMIGWSEDIFLSVAEDFELEFEGV